ncbi:MAG: hypothetical protein EON54_22840 [Alcaligenaceae bacterium]|nr:MAG: hypothetical protein EON54_22840 [Alcaligenaceae bacterium]
MSTISRAVVPVLRPFSVCVSALGGASQGGAFRRLAVMGLLCLSNAYAADEPTSVQQRARLAIAQEFQHLDFVWGAAEGDLNGDGVLDMALLLTGRKGESPIQERLFFLAGTSDGSYQVLSVSGEFCRPSKFYNLDIKNNALFVQAVYYADAARFSGYTLQFRYNAKIKDLEHIGEQQDDEDYSSGAYSRVSLNYLTKAAIHSRRAGKKYKEARGRMTDAPGILPLNGFVCEGYGMTSSSLYIGESFKVHEKGGMRR